MQVNIWLGGEYTWMDDSIVISKRKGLLCHGPLTTTPNNLLLFMSYLICSPHTTDEHPFQRDVSRNGKHIVSYLTNYSVYAQSSIILSVSVTKPPRWPRGLIIVSVDWSNWNKALQEYLIKVMRTSAFYFQNGLPWKLWKSVHFHNLLG